jgi:hypothetical protein
MVMSRSTSARLVAFAATAAAAIGACGGHLKSEPDAATVAQDAGSFLDGGGEGDASRSGPSDGSDGAPDVGTGDEVPVFDAGDAGARADGCIPVGQACTSQDTCCPTGPAGSSCQGAVCIENHGQ